MDSEFSPELALVCPDLAARARAALPDRPWEAFASPRTAIVRIGPAPGKPRDPSWAERISSAFPLVMLAAFVALLIVGSLPGLSKGPTLNAPDRPQAEPTLTVPENISAIPRSCPSQTLC